MVGMRQPLVTREADLPADLDPRSPHPYRKPEPGASRIHSRLLKVIFAILSALILLTSIGGWLLYRHLNGKITRVVLGLGEERPPETTSYGVENYLLVGTDSRAGSGGTYGDAPGQRSDTTILVHLAADGSSMMISFPRDTLVTIPEYTDADGRRHRAHQGKFNSAIALGGPSLLVRMVEKLTDIRIDHYLSMDLEGFRAITDAISGVEVCILPSTHRDVFTENGVRKVSTNTNDPMSGFLGGSGSIHVDGRMGLAFVRQRHGLPNGDLDRIQRQQQFIGAVVRKATSSGVLTNPVKLESLLSTAASTLTLDEDTTIADLRQLATRMRGAVSGTINMVTLPTHAPTRAEGAIGDTGELPGLGSVQIYDRDDLERIVAPLRGRKSGATGASPTTSSSAGSTGAPAAATNRLTIRVYNGTAVAGLAARAVTGLTGHGFQATNAGNASVRSHLSSKIIYGPGQDAAAATLQAAVPGSQLQRDPTATGIQLIVGSSFTGVESRGSGGQASGTAPLPTGTASTAQGPTGTPSSAEPSSAAPAPPPNCTY